MPNKKIIQNANEIVADLRNWANEFGHADDPYVAALADSLEHGTNLNYWANIDPLEYLPTTDAVTIIPSIRIARLLAAIRNVIIFAPVALTWAAVAEATKGFNAYSSANAGTPANFLLFWQNGFGYLGEFWRIGNIAQIDFMIVAIVIAFSIAVSYYQSRGMGLASKLQARFSRHRRLLGLQVRSFLFAHREVTSTEVSGEVASSIKQLRSIALETSESIAKLDKTASSLNEYVPALATLSKKLIEVATITDSSIKAMVTVTSDSIEKLIHETST